jgi:hypothetical protein
VEYAGFQKIYHNYIVHKRDVLTSCLNCASKLDWFNVVEAMKQQFNVVIGSLVQELE